jgi:hypothetical protein
MMTFFLGMSCFLSYPCSVWLVLKDIYTLLTTICTSVFLMVLCLRIVMCLLGSFISEMSLGFFSSFLVLEEMYILRTFCISCFPMFHWPTHWLSPGRSSFSSSIDVSSCCRIIDYMFAFVSILGMVKINVILGVLTRQNNFVPIFLLSRRFHIEGFTTLRTACKFVLILAPFGITFLPSLAFVC